MQFSHHDETESPFLVHQQSSFRGITKGISVYTHPESPSLDIGVNWALHTKQTKYRSPRVYFLEVKRTRSSTFPQQGSIGLSVAPKTHVYEVRKGAFPASIAWLSIESEIEQFSNRPVNWNSYGAHPISQPCKIVALEVVSLLEEENAMAADVNMTADSDVVISSRIGRYKQTWQIDVDGDIAVMVKRQNGATSYYDIPFGEVADFIQNLNNGTV